MYKLYPHSPSNPESGATHAQPDGTANGTTPVNPALLNLPQPNPPGKETYSLLNNHPLLPRQLHQPLRLVRISRERFLDEHMLARADRLGRPLEVQPVRRGDVHDVYVFIVQEILVRAVGFGEMVLFLVLLGCLEVARGDGVEDDGWVGFGGVNYLVG